MENNNNNNHDQDLNIIIKCLTDDIYSIRRLRTFHFNYDRRQNFQLIIPHSDIRDTGRDTESLRKASTPNSDSPRIHPL